jgi:taurine dioxygenase
LRLLQSYVIRLENTVRWRWRVGDVAFWDNRSTTQHYAIADHGNQPRRVQRVTIAGEVPISIDGQRSKVIQGDSSTYTHYTSESVAYG